MAWAKEQADIETRRYKENEERKTVLIPFHSDSLLMVNRFFIREGISFCSLFTMA